MTKINKKIIWAIILIVALALVALIYYIISNKITENASEFQAQNNAVGNIDYASKWQPENNIMGMEFRETEWEKQALPNVYTDKNYNEMPQLSAKYSWDVYSSFTDDPSSDVLMIDERHGGVFSNDLQLDQKFAYYFDSSVDDGIFYAGVKNGQAGAVFKSETTGEEYFVLWPASVVDFGNGFDDPFCIASDSGVNKDERSGKIYKFTKNNGKWEASLMIDLGDTIYAHSFVDKNSLYVVTFDSLLLVKDGKIEKVLVNNAFWGWLEPTSAEVYNNKIYIGMRGGIYCYDLSTKEQAWYVNKKYK